MTKTDRAAIHYAEKMSVMQKLSEVFKVLQQNPGDADARQVIENMIANLERSSFQATAARVKDILSTYTNEEAIDDND